MRKPRQREAKKHAQVARTAAADCRPSPLCSGRRREVVGGEGARVKETELLSQGTGLIFLFSVCSSPSHFLLSLKLEIGKKKKVSE